MLNKISEQLITGFPEAFYDLIAYIMPATFFIIGLTLQLYTPFYSIQNFVQEIVMPRTALVQDILIAVLVIGGLFLLGQLMTAVSDCIFICPFNRLMSLRKRNQKENKKSEPLPHWFNDYVEVKIRYPSMSPLITKSYAKHVATRNLLLAALILLFLSHALSHCGSVIFYTISVVILFYDSFVRKYWFENYAKAIIDVSNQEEQKEKKLEKNEEWRRKKDKKKNVEEKIEEKFK